MKKLLAILAVAGVLIACNDETTEVNSSDTTTTTTVDTTSVTPLDTTTRPADTTIRK